MIVRILGVTFALIDCIKDGDVPRFEVNRFVGPEFWIRSTHSSMAFWGSTSLVSPDSPGALS